MKWNPSGVTVHCETHIAIAICNYKRAAFGDDMKNTIKSIMIAIGLALVCASPAFAKEKEDEENLNSSEVPAAVMKAAEGQAKDGKIVRWEREHGKYEAVIEKGGKQWGVVIDEKGKVLSKHDESTEKGEKEEHGSH